MENKLLEVLSKYVSFKLQKQKMELILAIANKDLYNKIFENKTKGEEKNEQSK